MAIILIWFDYSDISGEIYQRLSSRMKQGFEIAGSEPQPPLLERNSSRENETAPFGRVWRHTKRLFVFCSATAAVFPSKISLSVMQIPSRAVPTVACLQSQSLRLFAHFSFLSADREDRRRPETPILGSLLNREKGVPAS